MPLSHYIKLLSSLLGLVSTLSKFESKEHIHIYGSRSGSLEIVKICFHRYKLEFTIEGILSLSSSFYQNGHYHYY